jgi:hypothetical protein
MPTEKDRLGDKLHDLEQAREDQYFARRDKELLERMRKDRDKEFANELKAAGTLICPRCGAQLGERSHHGVQARECPGCGGLWLDKEEVEVLAEREQDGWLGRLFRARER